MSNIFNAPYTPVSSDFQRFVDFVAKKYENYYIWMGDELDEWRNFGVIVVPKKDGPSLYIEESVKKESEVQETVTVISEKDEAFGVVVKNAKEVIRLANEYGFTPKSKPQTASPSTSAKSSPSTPSSSPSSSSKSSPATSPATSTSSSSASSSSSAYPSPSEEATFDSFAEIEIQNPTSSQSSSSTTTTTAPSQRPTSSSQKKVRAKRSASAQSTGKVADILFQNADTFAQKASATSDSDTQRKTLLSRASNMYLAAERMAKQEENEQLARKCREKSMEMKKLMIAEPEVKEKKKDAVGGNDDN